VPLEGGVATKGGLPPEFPAQYVLLPPKCPGGWRRPAPFGQEGLGWLDSRRGEPDLGRLNELAVDELGQALGQHHGPGRRVVADVPAVVNETVGPPKVAEPYAPGLIALRQSALKSSRIFLLPRPDSPMPDDISGDLTKARIKLETVRNALQALLYARVGESGPIRDLAARLDRMAAEVGRTEGGSGWVGSRSVSAGRERGQTRSKPK